MAQAKPLNASASWISLFQAAFQTVFAMFMQSLAPMKKVDGANGASESTDIPAKSIFNGDQSMPKAKERFVVVRYKTRP